MKRFSLMPYVLLLGAVSIVLAVSGCASTKHATQAESRSDAAPEEPARDASAATPARPRPAVSAKSGGIRILSNTNGVYSWVDANGNINIGRRNPLETAPRSSAVPADSPPAQTPRAQAPRELARPLMPPPVVLSAKIDRVLSGDRVRVEGREMRLLGIAAPRLYERGGPEALKFHRTLIEGKHVNIVLPPGEHVPDGAVPDAAFVFLDRLTFVNAELVRQGFARAARTPETQEYRALFVRLEERARSRHRGLWQ